MFVIMAAVMAMFHWRLVFMEVVMFVFMFVFVDMHKLLHMLMLMLMLPHMLVFVDIQVCVVVVMVVILADDGKVGMIVGHKWLFLQIIPAIVYVPGVCPGVLFVWWPMMVVTSSPGSQTGLPVWYPPSIQELQQLLCDTIKLKSQNIVKQKKNCMSHEISEYFWYFLFNILSHLVSYWTGNKSQIVSRQVLWILYRRPASCWCCWYYFRWKLKWETLKMDTL